LVKKFFGIYFYIFATKINGDGKMATFPYILGIESSCDDTSAAVVCGTKIVSNVIAGQKIHAEYGGVVPELASRAHQQNIIPVVDTAINRAGIRKEQISAIAYTNGPGLLGSLLVGSSFAKGLALSLKIPIIVADHLQAHVLANFLDTEENKPKPEFPFLCLTVSGGHTQLLMVHDYFTMDVLGKTIDDAAGEAFDKAAKILGLSYPGGPAIDQLAQLGDPKRFTFSIAKLPDLNFSFSGLKTSFLYFVRDRLIENPNFIEENLNDLAASLQFHIIKSLSDKMEKSLKMHKCSNFALSGGVAANTELRKRMLELAEKYNLRVTIPPLALTTDNAAMIACYGYFKYLQKDYADLNVIPYSSIK
jgi:N6-L-threonylcarbamoyladenine synthase